MYRLSQFLRDVPPGFGTGLGFLIGLYIVIFGIREGAIKRIELHTDRYISIIDHLAPRVLELINQLSNLINAFVKLFGA